MFDSRNEGEVSALPETRRAGDNLCSYSGRRMRRKAAVTRFRSRMVQGLTTDIGKLDCMSAPKSDQGVGRRIRPGLLSGGLYTAGFRMLSPTQTHVLTPI